MTPEAFGSTVNHELCTPLTSASGSLGLLVTLRAGIVFSAQVAGLECDGQIQAALAKHGSATIARLRENAKTVSIPVVSMTARAQSRELELFRALATTGVIPKPFDPTTLAAFARALSHPLRDA